MESSSSFLSSDVSFSGPNLSFYSNLLSSSNSFHFSLEKITLDPQAQLVTKASLHKDKGTSSHVKVALMKNNFSSKISLEHADKLADDFVTSVFSACLASVKPKRKLSKLSLKKLVKNNCIALKSPNNPKLIQSNKLFTNIIEESFNENEESQSSFGNQKAISFQKVNERKEINSKNIERLEINRFSIKSEESSCSQKLFLIEESMTVTEKSGRRSKRDEIKALIRKNSASDRQTTQIVTEKIAVKTENGLPFMRTKKLVSFSSDKVDRTKDSNIDKLLKLSSQVKKSNQYEFSETRNYSRKSSITKNQEIVKTNGRKLLVNINRDEKKTNARNKLIVQMVDKSEKKSGLQNSFARPVSMRSRLAEQTAKMLGLNKEMEKANNKRSNVYSPFLPSVHS